MDNLDVLQLPTLPLLSSSSNKSSSGQSALPETIGKIVKRKLYKRTTTRVSPTSSGLRRSSSSKSSSPYRNRRHKWRTLHHKDGATSSFGDFFNRRKSRKASSSTDTTPSSTRSAVSPAAAPSNRSTSTISSTRGQISTPKRTSQSEQNLIIIESDDDDNENPITPSPIRNSPSYRRRSKRRDASSSVTTLASSSSLYPELPMGTSTNFVRYNLKIKDDTTIDSELIGKLREGPTGEVWNRKLGQVYTAAMEGENDHVKIGWTENLEKRMASLNSPKKHAKIWSVEDKTPGAQSRLMNCYHAEQIIHLELYNFRRLAVDREETEWFEMDMTQTQRVCHKWRTWLLQCDPYDENRQLTGFWTHRLDHTEKRNAYNAAKHGSLHERWMAFLNPSWWDKKSYEVLVIWRKFYKW